MSQVSVRFPPTERRELEKYAEAHGILISDAVREAVRIMIAIEGART